MPQGLKASLSWPPYLFLLLIPLALVGLDSFGMFTRLTPSDQPMGLWPRHLQAGSPKHLSLQLPPGGPAPEGLEIRQGSQVQLVKAKISGQNWDLSLPALAPGNYSLRLMNGTQPLDPVYPLAILAPAFWQLRSDRQAYAPGDWMVLSLQTAKPVAGLALEVLGPQGETLLSQRMPSQTGVWQQRVRLPETLTAGNVSILLSQQRHPLESRSITLINPTPAPAPLQISPTRRQMLAGSPQELGLTLLDGLGQPVETGWISVLGRTLAVQHGQTILSLSATELAPHLAFAAGDSRGNLLQGSLEFELLSAPWLPLVDLSGRVEVLSQQPQRLSWLLGQGSRVIAQGQADISAANPRIALPEILDQQSLWLLLCDRLGNSQQLHWLPQPPISRWPLRPVRPHALQPLRVEPAVSGGQLESFHSLQLGFSAIEPGNGRAYALMQPVGLPLPASERPGWLSCWSLLALGLPLLPLLWLWYSLVTGQRPFPNAARRKISQRGQLLALCTSAAALLGLMLSWSGAYVPAAVLGLAAGLALAVIQGWLLLPLLQKRHPLLAWVPTLQLLLLGIAFWFMLTYQPALLGAGLLALGLFGLAWSTLWQRLILLARLQRFHLLSLAMLVVAACAHMLILPSRPQLGPAGAFERERILKTPALVERGLLLDHQIWPANAAQILPAARRSGLQTLHWRHWREDGRVQDYRQPLKVQPGLLAEIQLPAFAHLGDQLSLPLRFVNETPQTQELAWRFNQVTAQTRSIAARSEITLNQAITFDRPGWQVLPLEHRFLGQWYAQSQRIFVQPVPASTQDPRLELRIDLPQHQDLVLGEEIPVLVHLRQLSGRRTGLGLQLELPAGYLALVDTLGASARRLWLASYDLHPGSINLRTLPLANGQEVSFHFRLRAFLPGRVQLPPARLFLLDQPTVNIQAPATQWLEAGNS
ncbi:MAG: hypothetical protein ACAI44_28780 [Candidatus Sericytochromatia bacterium]